MYHYCIYFYFSDITWREQAVHDKLQLPHQPPLPFPLLPMAQEVTDPHEPASVRRGISVCVWYCHCVTCSGLTPPLTGENQSEAKLVLLCIILCLLLLLSLLLLLFLFLLFLLLLLLFLFLFF